MSDAQIVAKPASRKRAANLTVDSALLAKAKAFGLNVSSVLESALRATIRAEEERRWHEENTSAIEALNEEYRTSGLWYDHFRKF